MRRIISGAVLAALILAAWPARAQDAPKPPKLELPKIEMPKLEMPKMEMPDVSGQDVALTALASAIDQVAAKLAPRYNYGRRYDLQRQTYSIEYSFYESSELQEDPGLFYVRPKGLPDVQVARRLKDNRRYEVSLIKWRSQYEPQNPEFALVYEKYLETQIAWAVVCRSKTKRNRGAIVIAHRWTRRDVARYWKRAHLEDYADMGYDTVFLQLPYHGRRALYGSIFSGEHFLSGEVARVNEAMCQSVTDIRSMVEWLRSMGYEFVGLKGESIGATAALMTAVVDDDIDFVIAWKPISSIGDLSEKSPIAPEAVTAMHAGDLDEDAVKKILWLSSPANFSPAIPVQDVNDVDHVIVFAGLGDNFLGSNQAVMLARKWAINDRRMVWYAGGYMVNFQPRACAQAEARFLRGIMSDPAVTPETYSKATKPREKWYKKKPWEWLAQSRTRETAPGVERERWYKSKWWKREKPADLPGLDEGPGSAEPAPLAAPAPAPKDPPAEEAPKDDRLEWHWETPNN